MGKKQDQVKNKQKYKQNKNKATTLQPHDCTSKQRGEKGKIAF